MAGTQAPGAAAHEPPTVDSGLEIRIDSVTHVLGGRPVLDGLSLSVAPGERLGIVGRSGSGKSTLLSLIAGLSEPTHGAITVGTSADPRRRLAACALMPQRDCLLPWRTALDNACLPLENRGVGRAEARARARPLFERLGLGGSEAKRPAALSGGMRQRVAFARTLLAEKGVLLLDEPFGALDAITRSELQTWLGKALDAEPRTVVLVTHDVEEALLLCDRIAVLTAGSITAELVVERPIGATRRETVTDPAFVALRERTLEAIG